jgi:hypothetical protein
MFLLNEWSNRERWLVESYLAIIGEINTNVNINMVFSNLKHTHFVTLALHTKQPFQLLALSHFTNRERKCVDSYLQVIDQLFKDPNDGFSFS